ncbi:unnamed protein product [Rotaria sordida]|uniref:Uncharacterized protein n=1 Tax=Rotaria sordida TaxID=392033 RepID=A0A814U068_9BILA|nr:unnamed protein product [Rotaria sordida]
MRSIDIAVGFPLNPKMKQVHLKLLLCLLLAISVTGQYNPAAFVGHRLAGQTGFGSYNLVPGANSYGNFGQQSNARMFNLGNMASVPAANNLGQYSQQPAQTTVNRQPVAGEFVSNVQVPPRDQSYGDGSNSRLSNGNSNKYNRHYVEPTGQPYGIQSTGEILNYQPEKLDLSKCGPMPTTNPCTLLGPQYHPLPGHPHCYIHCAFGRLFVKPCSPYLVWNARINNCDWPTIASPMSNNDYGTTSYSNRGSKSGSSSYETTNKNYAMSSMYPYGRKKRSTIERKKRNFGTYYQGLMMPSTPQQYSGYNVVPFPYQPGPPRLPMTPFSLPGPVSFPGQVGLASIPSQFVPSQSPTPTFVSFSVPAASAPVPVAPVTPAPVPVTPAPVPVAPVLAPNIQPRGFPTFGGSYFDFFNPQARSNPAVVPATPPVAPTAPSAVTTASFFPVVPSSVFSSPMFQQQSMTPSTSYAAPTPVSLTATLIPGPFYPYGPPFGGPFGRRAPPPAQPSVSQLSSPFGSPAAQLMARFGLFGGQGLSPFMSFGGQPMSPPMSFGAHPLSSFRSFGGQQLPTTMSFGGQQLPTAMPFGGQQFPSFMSFGGQQLPPFMPFGGQRPSPLRPFGGPLRGRPFGPYPPDNEPLGLDFDLHVFPADDESDEDQNDDSSSKGDGKSVNDSKTSDKANSGKSPTTDADFDALKKSDYKRNGNFKGYGGKNRDDDYDADDDPYGYDDGYPSVRYRYKRQYGSYGTTVRQMPTVPVGERQQSRLNSNELTRRPSFQSSPCIGKSPRSNIAHPTDPEKYIACLTKLRYEIMDCPTGLIYNPTIDQCEKRKNLESICEHERPCMNNGQCYQTSSTTYKCTCRGAWTGERCETPLSTCATNPCGPGNECQTLKTGEYKQDYVCVCNEGQSYGLSCGRNTVPNPCLSPSTEQEQYYPFTFSPQAFVQCNGDILYVLPCASGLHWNQEQKVCDRIEMFPTMQSENQPQSYEMMYGTNEQRSAYTRPMPNVVDQAFIKQQSYQQRLEQMKQPQMMTNEQSSTSINKVVPVPQQSTFNQFQMFSHHSKQKPSMSPNNYMMSQEQPILTSRSSLPIPVMQSEIVRTYLPKPQYDQTYNEPPRPPLSFIHQQPARPNTRLVKPELPRNSNMQ